MLYGGNAAHAIALAIAGLHERPDAVGGQAIFVTKGRPTRNDEYFSWACEQLGRRLFVMPAPLRLLTLATLWCQHHLKRLFRRSVPGVALYESEAILDHLFEHYGDGSPPLLLRGPLAAATGSLASGWRLGKGTRVRPSKPPARPLELWSFEASPFSRIVRETLCTLEIPYRLHNVGRGSPSRDAFVARSGKMQVPYLEDPNTDVAMFESAVPSLAW